MGQSKCKLSIGKKPPHKHACELLAGVCRPPHRGAVMALSPVRRTPR